MRAWTAEMAMAMVLVSGCYCNVPLIKSNKFRLLPLREQIAVYDEAKRKHCVLEPDTRLLVIAFHGAEAAEAMTSSLKGNGPAFPPRDAVEVLELVHFGGVDLRQREALRVLEELARSAPDPVLRKRARLAVARISKNDPLLESSD
jgi:hypothetical protein